MDRAINWKSYKDEPPRIEFVYLVFSPRCGYQTLAWENKAALRDSLWHEVTYWTPFEFLPYDLQQESR
jgi:hypothetical protein